MDTTLKLTKQGIRDLNSYGPRPKPAVADAPILLDAEGQPVPAAPAPVAQESHQQVRPDGAVVATTDGSAP